jgi:hypothetical protein
VVVSPCEQACPGGRAERGRTEVGKAHSLLGKAIDVRCGYTRSVAAELRVPDVIEHDENDVRSSGGRGGNWRPPRVRVAPVSANLAFEKVGAAHREGENYVLVSGPWTGCRNAGGATPLP